MMISYQQDSGTLWLYQGEKITAHTVCAALGPLGWAHSTQSLLTVPYIIHTYHGALGLSSAIHHTYILYSSKIGGFLAFRMFLLQISMFS